MNRPEIVLILARAENGVIGKDGTIPWHISADLRRFKTITMGAPMIMGRKTFDGLPGLLPGRRHIVLTRDAAWEEEGAEVVHSVPEAIKIANAPHVWVIGGAEIYALLEPLADRIELTEVHAAVEGDARVAAFSSAWTEVARESHAAENGAPAFDFVTLKRETSGA
jgi:dihydrofolate reductase